MSNVIPLASARAGATVQPTAPTSPPPTDQAPAIARLQAIENALSMALYWIRHQEHPGNIHAATVRAVRAASMLKQACKDAQPSGRAGS